MRFETKSHSFFIDLRDRFLGRQPIKGSKVAERVYVRRMHLYFQKKIPGPKLKRVIVGSVKYGSSYFAGR
jgi:hypothetical protein